MPVMLERWNDDKMDALATEVHGLDVKVARLDTRVETLDKKVDKSFEQVDKRFEQVDEEFKAVRKEMSAGFDRLFWKLLGTGFSIAAVAFGLAEFL